MNRDLDKARAWRERSARRAAERAKERPRVPLARRREEPRVRAHPIEVPEAPRKTVAVPKAPKKPLPEHRRVVERARARFGPESWRLVETVSCARPGCDHRAVQLHHVVFQQEVRRRGGELWDRRNGIPLCLVCHGNLHQHRDFPLAALPDAAWEFAVELLDAGAAYEYLRRRYGGEDERLQALIAPPERT